jgi:hypothetical protein
MGQLCPNTSYDELTPLDEVGESEEGR